MAAEVHSKVGPSSLERVFGCGGSVALTAGMDEETSEFAEEGTAAHALAEWKLLKLLKRQAGKRPTSDYWTDEMEECTDNYSAFCMDQYGEAKAECKDAIVFVEQQVSVEEYAPGCFGTVDFMALSDKRLWVTDFKYGRGIMKDAENNPQLMAYGLGALTIADPIYEVDELVLTIYQPRLSHVSTWTVSADDLRDWAENVLKPKVAEALSGNAPLNAGEWCRFCRARHKCRARADHYLKLVDLEFQPPELLSDDEIAQVMSQAEELSRWVSDVMEYASVEAIENGKKWPNWKLVEGRSVRKFSADDKTIEAAAKAAGYSDIYTKSLLTITGFEKLMGKEKCQEILGSFITKPAGKLTLVPASDKRPEATVTSDDVYND